MRGRILSSAPVSAPTEALLQSWLILQIMTKGEQDIRKGAPFVQDTWLGVCRPGWVSVHVLCGADLHKDYKQNT